MIRMGGAPSMKIFISWSGEKSKKIAEALREWLPDVFLDVDPWISSEDIDIGARWSIDISNQLKDSRLGIICLTKGNLAAPWLLFEAGALSKALERTHVCPYLLDLKPAEINGPLAQFQSVTADESGTQRLLQTINKIRDGQPLSKEKLLDHFNVWWPRLEIKLAEINRIEEFAPETPPINNDLSEEFSQLILPILEKIRYNNDKIDLQKINPHDTFLDSILNIDNEVNILAAKFNLKGSDEDSNAIQWSEDETDGTRGELDGFWSSRWDGGTAGKYWREGTAKIMSLRNFVCIIFDDDLTNYLIIARYQRKKLLVGRYFNLSSAHDSTPWVGLIVNQNRIDGQWSGGRWDFRRCGTITQQIHP